MSSPKATKRTVADEDAERERLAELQRLAELCCQGDLPFTEEQELILGPILRRWATQYPPPAVPDEAA